ncbi:dTDP-glucose 4,6-dehydratase, partial [Candidatus Uhrbacteria bacterium]|nr:dTDP-glucose 4,6-dehydratase [Candidatus Uhrbacteria bacterium]
MKILVTGGAGFMGSNFIRYMLLAYSEYEIVNLDKLTYAGNLTNLKDVDRNPRYSFIQGDIADEKVVAEAVKGVDVIVNYAAETHVDRSILDPKAFIVTDVLGTYTLLEAVRTYNVPRAIQISTDEVFGSIVDGEFSETSSFEPNSPYAASKAGGDHLCRAYVKTYNAPVIVTHSCNFFGPYQYPEKMLPLFITNLLEGKTVPLYGDGQNIREWIYTEDHCRAIDLILHKGKIGDVYNIGTGDRFTNSELTTMVLTALGKGEEMIERVKDRLGHDRRYAIDSAKLRTELGWKPQYTFNEALTN